MTSSHGVLNYVMLVVMEKDTVHDMIHYAIEQLHAMSQVQCLTEMCGNCTGLIISFIVVQL